MKIFCLLLFVSLLCIKGVASPFGPNPHNIPELIKLLDSSKYEERQQANKILSNIVTQKDVPVLEKAYRKSKSAEQKLRLFNILTDLGWIPKKIRKKLDKLFDLLKSPESHIRKQASEEILSMPNGAKYLEQKFKSINPGKLSLKMETAHKFILSNETIDIKFTLTNADKHGFFINVREALNALDLSVKWQSFSKDKSLSYTIRDRVSNNLWWDNTINEFDLIKFIRPNENIQIIQKFTNHHKPGFLTIEGIYKNTKKDLCVRTFGSGCSLIYSVSIKANLWCGIISISKSIISVPSITNKINTNDVIIENNKLKILLTNSINKDIVINLSKLIVVAFDNKFKNLDIRLFKINDWETLTINGNSSVLCSLEIGDLLKNKTSFSIQCLCERHEIINMKNVGGWVKIWVSNRLLK